jgi:hypothetical protein
VLADAGCAKIVARTADGDHECVIGDVSVRRDLAALVIVGGGEMHEPVGPVEPDHFPEAEVEPMPGCLGQIVELVRADVDAAGGSLVEERLPEVRAGGVDQRDFGLALAPELIAQPRYQLEPARPAAHDDDPMQAGMRKGDPLRSGSSLDHLLRLQAKLTRRGPRRGS